MVRPFSGQTGTTYRRDGHGHRLYRHVAAVAVHYRLAGPAANRAAALEYSILAGEEARNVPALCGASQSRLVHTHEVVGVRPGWIGGRVDDVEFVGDVRGGGEAVGVHYADLIGGHALGQY